LVRFEIPISLNCLQLLRWEGGGRRHSSPDPLSPEILYWVSPPSPQLLALLLLEIETGWIDAPFLIAPPNNRVKYEFMCWLKYLIWVISVVASNENDTKIIPRVNILDNTYSKPSINVVIVMVRLHARRRFQEIKALRSLIHC